MPSPHSTTESAQPQSRAPLATILVIDDIPTNLEILSTLLEHYGYRVAIATDGQTALNSLQQLTPDLILLDIMMPEMDGFDTCRQLKTNEKTREIPIIFTTAIADEAHKVAAFDLGAVDYITKPFQTAEVLARVQTHLQIRRLNQQLATQVAELNSMVADLKQAQSQLVQKEKMSGLGHLVAGIAHEINNPINFIYGNAEHVSNYADSLMTMLQLYQQHYPTPVSQIIEKADDLDIDFISKDLPKLTSSMQDGAHRIHQIVLSLRNFSRLDEADLKHADLAEGIDNTLLLVRHRLRATDHRPEIEVVKAFEPLPEIECYPSKLNQVLMHLLNNAIDALDNSQTPSPQITIRLSQPSYHIVQIAISDNGPGIAPKVQSKIFDPFFTTKPVGQGTGLGLSVSYQIITDEHQGHLSYHTAPGGGAEFRLEIPCKQSQPVSPQHPPSAREAVSL